MKKIFFTILLAILLIPSGKVWAQNPSGMSGIDYTPPQVKADNQTLLNASTIYSNAIKPNSPTSLEEINTSLNSVNEIIGRRGGEEQIRC